MVRLTNAWLVTLCMGMAGAFLYCAPARSEETSAYVKKATWAETMAATREALLAQRPAGGFEPCVTEVIKGRQEAQHISVDVRGLEQLWLIATIGPDTYSYDQAIWADPKLIANDGKEVLLITRKPVTAKVGWGSLARNKNHIGKPLRIADKEFKTGFWAHAPSELCFALDKQYARFEAWVGIGADAGANGSVQFKVADQKEPLRGLWDEIRGDFPAETARLEQDAPGGCAEWFGAKESAALEAKWVSQVVDELGPAAGDLREQFTELSAGASGKTALLALYAEAAARRDRIRTAQNQIKQLNLSALRLAIEDLSRAFPEDYPDGPDYLRRLDAYEKWAGEIREQIAQGRPVELKHLEAVSALQREALLANPLLDFDELLLVNRRVDSPSLGLPANWQGNCSLARVGYDNEIALMSMVNGRMTRVFKPDWAVFVGDVELYYDAEKLMFSMSSPEGPWRIWEAGIDGTGLQQVSPCDEEDVDCYDACYLPDGRIILSSTAPMRGVPCVDGSSYVANFYLLDADRQRMRQLCFDQEHNWCPTMLNNGRVLYSRWEYTDTPHSQTRVLFSMNPDGTGQMEYYGSNSFWPNGVFYARPVPGHPTMVAGIVTGHHGVRRMGELVLFDPAIGRHEANGVVQRIPGYGKTVEPIIKDQLVDASWPKFLHPYPLSEKYFIVSCQPTPDSLWGIYLVDVFDNILLMREEPGFALLEPIPVKKTPRPPVIADKVDLKRDDAVVYLADVYAGPGLKGIPRGAVKQLRVFSYHYSFRHMGGLLGVVGMDGPWDIRRVLGTVPVEEDGSALFRIPANTPIAVQPLDAEGKALQQMRSWFTGMPGETLSCVGCHEKVNSGPPVQSTMAARRAPSDIKPWHGPTRGFSFAREVQPVLDAHCVRCHDGQKQGLSQAEPAAAGGDGTVPLFDLRGTEKLKDWSSVTPGQGARLGGKFSVSYAALHKYIRRPGIESDYHMLEPMEFHADTTELVQMLKDGHHGVELDAESWDRLITWIDMNAPYHGYWHEVAGENAKHLAARAVELGAKYDGIRENAEVIPELARPKLKVAAAKEDGASDRSVGSDGSVRLSSSEASGGPGSSEVAGAASHQQHAAKGVVEADTRKMVSLGGGGEIEFALVPAGTCVMGDDTGATTVVTIHEPFWMSRCEITNEQFALFDPSHDSRVEPKHAYQFGVHGFPVNEPLQPVVRVTWQEAAAFCQWLSERTGDAFALPSEIQWEYACRAGSDAPFYYGDVDADFSPYANLADAKLREFADNPYAVYDPLKDATPYDDWIPKDARFNDGVLVSAEVGRYQPNAWGLHDMHGNVWEWTRERESAPASAGKVVVRGGSWYDRPKRATASFRLTYQPWQPVFNVGFRVVCAVRPNVVAQVSE